MTSKYQKRKERLRKEVCERYQNLIKLKKTESKKRSEKDIKIFLKNKSRNYLRL